MRHYVSTGFGTFQGGVVTKYLTFTDLKQIHFVLMSNMRITAGINVVFMFKKFQM